jgi:amino acid adenylation domain-containing protein
MGNVIQIIGQLAEAGIEVFLDKEKLKARALKGAMSAQHIALIKGNKPQLITYLLEKSQLDQVFKRPKIIAEERKSNKLLPSYAQQRLWFIDQMDGGSEQYNMPSAMRIKGDFKVEVAQAVFTQIIQRHETLRTVFVNDNDSPMQLIREEFEFFIDFQDISKMSQELQQDIIDKKLREDAKKSFDLAADLMLRVAYLNISAEEGIMLLNLHHIATDGWSMGILVKEFVTLYDAYLLGKASPLPALKIQYADYASWQRQWLQGDVLESQLSYWDKQLADIPQVHSLPLDFERPVFQNHNGAVYDFKIEYATLKKLNAVALENQASLFMLIHAAFSILLSRYSNSDDIVIGTPVANRLQKELEPLIGFFVNTLVLRADCTNNPTFIDFLAQIKKINVAAQDNQDIAFEQLVDRLKPSRSTSHNALFQIMLSMNNTEESDLTLANVQLSPVKKAQINVKFDLLMKAQAVMDQSYAEKDRGLYCSFAYNTDILTAQSIQRLANGMQHLFAGIAADASQKIKQLPILSKNETAYLINDLNQSQGDFAENHCFHQIFEKQCHRTPDNMALIYNDTQLSYSQYNQQTNQLAHYLQEQQVGIGDFVGLYLSRSLEMMLAIMAVLKAGAAYLPLDPSNPSNRIDEMISDSGLKLVLSTVELSQQLDNSRVAVLALDDKLTKADLSSYSSDNPICHGLNNNHIAYMIYTSGSTGKPKGVTVTHKSIVNYVQAIEHYCHDVEGAIFITNLSFDGTLTMLLPPLIKGLFIKIIPDNNDKFETLTKELTSKKNKHLFKLTPSFLDAARSLLKVSEPQAAQHTIFLGGETFYRESYTFWSQLLPDSTFINHYGPTETTVGCSTFVVNQENSKNFSKGLPIGRPLANYQFYILDYYQNLLPFGSIGELCIGGAGLAQGYLNRIELTNEKFINNPFSDEKDDRLYRSGDLVRYLPDGKVEFLGRLDHQVKIRGFRIELGEIDSQLLDLACVHNCLVTVYVDKHKEQRILAYVTSESKLKEAELKTEIYQQLQTSLPDYMLPSLLVVLDEMPLTANGKIDRKALPEPDSSSQRLLASGHYIAPQSQTEMALAEIWSALLHLEISAISSNSDFFECGGHSLLSIKLVSEVRSSLSAELTIRDIFEFPKLSALAQAIDNSHGIKRPQIMAQDRSDKPMILSYAQQRLWFIDKMDGGSSHYNMPSVMRLRGDFKVAVAEAAFAQIIQRHECLRTIFIEDKGQPVQMIRAQVDFNIRIVDLTPLDSNRQQQQVTQAIKKHAERVFDLSRDLLLHVAYLQLSADEGVLLFNMHHIASDGWSIGLLVKEFVSLYESNLHDVTSNLPALAIQYADYAYWQRQWLQGEVLESQLSYWHQQLADLPQVHNLPLDFERPKFQTFNGAMQYFHIDAETLAQLKALALENHVTLFMLIHAAFAVLLSRYSNSSDIVIGIPVANRLQKELEPIIGFFANTLVLRADCANNPSFTDFLSQIKDVNLQAQANQDVPFEHLVDHLNPPRNTAHNALFQIMFSMNTNEEFEMVLPNVSLIPERIKQVAAKFDLLLKTQVTTAGIDAFFQYNTDLFKASSIEALATSMQLLLKDIVKDAKANIAQLSILDDQQKQHLLQTINNNKTDYADLCIHQLFEKQVSKTPDNMTLYFAEQSLSYAELNSQANQLARHLLEQGVQPSDIVGLYLERSTVMIVALLAILKTGAAYLPLDPSYPRSRLQHMMNDAAQVLLLSQQDLLHTVDWQGKKLCIDDQQLINILKQNCTDNLNIKGLKANDLAYVIYTSGSTGKPKGVMQTHRTITNLVQAQASEAGLGESMKTLQFAPIGFDVSIQEIASSWYTGSPLLIISKGQKEALNELPQLLQKNAIERVFLPPAVLNWLAEELTNLPLQLPQLKEIVVAGEALHISPYLRAYLTNNPNCTLWNHYGPTETHVATIAIIDAGAIKSKSTPPIGKVLSNLSAYVLDPQQQLVPYGAVGELYIAGAGLAQGYLNDTELSDERFIQHQFNQEDPQRLYRTGDLVRYQQDGNLQFLGRADDQVKIRGFRIELGEIEQQLLAHPAVQAVLVLVKESEQEKTLLAYIATDSQVKKPELINSLKTELSQHLPSYMVPSVFILLESLPLTANGKIDRKALPLPEMDAMGADFITATGKTQQKLAEIWASLLKISTEKIGAKSDFFALGGHSLLSVRLLAEIRESFACELSVRDIFSMPQLADMAEKIDGSQSHSVTKITAVKAKQQRLEPSFAQQRLWFVEQMEGGSAHYNMPSAMRLKGVFNLVAAQQAFSQIIARHEVLRTVFTDGDKGPIQHIKSEFNFAIKEIDLSALTTEEQRLKALIKQNANMVFDLSSDLMLAVSYIKLSQNEGVLLFNIHHIAFDGWSAAILIKEFATLYQANLQGRENPLSPLAIQYADYAYWQRNWLKGEVLDSQLNYWQQQLADLPQVHNLSLDFERPAYQTFNGGRHHFKIDKATLNELKTIALENQATLFMLVHAVFSILLSRFSNNSDIVIGTAVANRRQKELEALIGFFVNTLVLRTDCGKDQSFAEFLQQVKSTNLDAQANQDIPFEYLVDQLNPERSTSHSALFQILLSMNTNESSELQLPGLSLSPLENDRIVAKTDLMLNVEAVQATADIDGGLFCSFTYNTDIFKAETIERLANGMQSLFKSICADVTQSVSRLPVISAKEKHYLIDELNAKETDYQRELCIHELFEQRVKETPDNTAVVFAKQSLSYAQLNAKANQLAHYLLAQGRIKPDDLIGVCVDRSLQMMIVILAILKAGAAYLPLDPSYPIDRIKYMLEDSQVKLILAQKKLLSLLSTTNHQVVLVDDHSLFNTYSKGNIDRAAISLSVSNLAYIVYTSGSTGQPKGVMIEHRSVLNLSQFIKNYFSLDAQSKVLHFASFNFDSATVEWIMALLNSACLYICDQNCRRDAKVLENYLHDHVLTHAILPPALLKHLDHTRAYSFKMLMVAGEEFDQDLCLKWGRKYPFYNGYGPSETTVCASISTPLWQQKINIGKQMSNTKVYILDKQQQLLPFGTAGELYVSGESLARGYLNQPELTAEKFIANPFSKDPKARMYRTGDLVRYMADENLEFMGRIDHQVKIRGFRIELGEIEACLIALRTFISHILLSATMKEQRKQSTLLSS